MVGKNVYGTVGENSPANVEQLAIGVTTGDKSTLARLRKLFKPPVDASGNEYTDEVCRAQFEKLVLYDRITEDPKMWGGDGVDRTFSGAPDLPNDVPTGGNGLPSTAWTPNQASPGVENGVPTQSPTGQADLGLDKSGGKTVGVDGRQNPKTVSKSISDGAKLPPSKGSHDQSQTIKTV